MKNPNTHTQTAFRLFVASVLATTLFAVTPIATAEEPKKAIQKPRPEEKDIKDDIHERQDMEQRTATEKRGKPAKSGITTTRGIAEDKNWGDRQTKEGKKSDRLQGTFETQKKPSTNNVRAQSAKAKAIKTHIQTLHQQISDIYSKRHDVISDKTKPQNERNQESKKLLDQAKALEEKLNKAAEQYQQILSSTSIVN